MNQCRKCRKQKPYDISIQKIKGAKITLIDIPNRFRKLRSARGFSVYRLARESDVSENYIHKIERGENKPSVYILEKLLTCLGVTLPEFLNESTEIMYPSDFERELIESVRTLPAEKASAILHIAKLIGK